MRLHRFILPIDLSADRLEISDREAVNQMRNVFRMGPGDAFVACDGRGREAVARIEEIDRIVLARIEERREAAAEDRTRVTLYAAMLKREQFELVVQKAVELGAAEIVPVLTARTVKLGARADRLRKIAREAAEQSGRGVVPEVREPVTLRAAVADCGRHDVNLLLDPGASPVTVSPFSSRPASLGLFVGPEGGWDSTELESLRAHGMIPLGLGTRILRAETACIVGVFLAGMWSGGCGKDGNG